MTASVFKVEFSLFIFTMMIDILDFISVLLYCLKCCILFYIFLIFASLIKLLVLPFFPSQFSQFFYCLNRLCQQIWKTQQWPQDWKSSVFIPIPKKGNVKECLNYDTIALISHATKVMLKILQARLQQYMNHELPDVQAGFRKGRGTRDQIAIICWIIKKAREFPENIYFCFIDYAKAFDCVDHNKL